jgi:hypothetical protein
VLDITSYNDSGDATSCEGFQTTFTTEANSSLTPPFTETFTNYLPTNWTENQGKLLTTTDFGDSYDSSWATRTFGNAGSNKGPGAGLNTWYTNLDEWLISPSIDLGDGSTPYQLEFDLALTWAYDRSSDDLDADDKFAVVISTDNGVTWSSANILREWSNDDTISNTGEHITILLEAYTGVVKLGFYFESTIRDSDANIYIDNVEVAEIEDIIWDGTSWSGGTAPTENDNVIIRGDCEKQDINASNLTIESGVQLTINAGNILNVKGNLTNDGNILFKSTSVSDGVFLEYTGADVAGTGTVTVQRDIQPKAAWRMLTAPLKEATGESNLVSDNWQLYRDINNSTGVNLWTDDSNTTGMHIVDASVTNSDVNIKKYPTDPSFRGWVPVTNSQTEPLFNTTRNNAFALFATGPYTATPPLNFTTETSGVVRLSATGNLITGNQVYADVPTNIHTFIGNPYPCPIDPALLLSDNPNFDTIWVWDPAISDEGAYITYDPIVGWSNTGEGTNYEPSTMIQSGLAFFVKPTTTATFTIKEAHKGTETSDVKNVFGPAPALLTKSTKSATSNAQKTTKSNALAAQVRAALYKNNNDLWQNEDAVVAAFSAAGDNALTSKDSKKLFKGGVNLAITQSGASLTIEHRNIATTEDVVALKVTSGETDVNYKLVLNTVNYNDGLTPYLYDNVLNTYTQIPTDGSETVYSFSFSNASNESERFSIVFKTNDVLNTLDVALEQLTTYPNPATDVISIGFTPTIETLKYTLYNVLGQKVKEGTCTKNNNSIDVNNLKRGVYNLQLSDQQSKVTKLLILK